MSRRAAGYNQADNPSHYENKLEIRDLSDEALLQLIIRSHEQALSELYDRYVRLIYSLAFNATSDRHLAEEITQDVFMRIWEKAETFRPQQGKVSTWIASIARYRAIDMLRRKSARPEGYQDGWSTQNELELPDPLSVEAKVEDNLRRRQVRLAIAGLPEEQRKVLGYAFFQGYSHSQIAELLGEPLGTVKTRLRLAMQKLRQQLEGS